MVPQVGRGVASRPIHIDSSAATSPAPLTRSAGRHVAENGIVRRVSTSGPIGAGGGVSTAPSRKRARVGVPEKASVRDTKRDSRRRVSSIVKLRTASQSGSLGGGRAGEANDAREGGGGFRRPRSRRQCGLSPLAIPSFPVRCRRVARAQRRDGVPIAAVTPSLAAGAAATAAASPFAQRRAPRWRRHDSRRTRENSGSAGRNPVWLWEGAPVCASVCVRARARVRVPRSGPGIGSRRVRGAESSATAARVFTPPFPPSPPPPSPRTRFSAERASAQT